MTNKKDEPMTNDLQMAIDLVRQNSRNHNGTPMLVEAVEIMVRHIDEQEVLAGAFMKAESIAAQRVNAMQGALESATRRSSYAWSDGGEYTQGDYMNEGSIALANNILSTIQKAGK